MQIAQSRRPSSARPRNYFQAAQRFAVLFGALVLLSCAAYGQSVNPHLYEVRKGAARSYVFGTVHTGVSLANVEEAVMPRFETARVIYFELVNLQRAKLWLTNPVEALKTSKDSGLGQGEPLSTVVKERLIRDYMVAPALVDSMKKSSCGTLSQAMEIGQPRLDHELIIAASSFGKEMRALDTDELRSIAKKSTSEVCDIETQMLSRPLSQWQRDFARTTENYLAGTIELDDYYRSDDVRIRNTAWVAKTTPEFETGGVFLAAGVDHLYGTFGLISLLSAQGFEVRRVR